MGDCLMSKRGLSMKKIKEIIYLSTQANLSNRKIAKALAISPGSVSYYLQAWSDSTLDWLSIQSYDDEELLTALLPHCKQRQPGKHDGYLVPDYQSIHKELKQKGINRQLLFDEYVKNNTSGKHYSYTQFCRGYRDFLKQLEPSMRITHNAGEKCFIDYCGPRIAIYDKSNDIAHRAYLFVASLGASNYTFAIATLTRSLPDWIFANTKTLEFFGGVPILMVPDNEKSGVHEASYYDPDVNPTYADFARYYETIILPTRPRKPKDKAKVEKSVQFAETWIIGKLRHQKFYSLDVLNQAIKPLLQGNCSPLTNQFFQKAPCQ